MHSGLMMSFSPGETGEGKNQMVLDCGRFLFLFIHLYVRADLHKTPFGSNLQFKGAEKNTASCH